MEQWQVPRKCLQCGIEFTPTLPQAVNAEFCSVEHRKAYWGYGATAERVKRMEERISTLESIVEQIVGSAENFEQLKNKLTRPL